MPAKDGSLAFSCPFPSFSCYNSYRGIICRSWIISPSSSADEVIDKVDEYFRAGTRLVWVIYPNAQRVYVYTLPTDVTAIDNLVVDDFHTYFVGRPGLLVHNPAARRWPCRPVCMCHRRRNGLAAGSLFASRPLFVRHFSSAG